MSKPLQVSFLPGWIRWCDFFQVEKFMKKSIVVCISDLEEAARRRLPKVVFDYLCGGAEDEQTLRRNRDAFASWQLRSRVLTGHSKPDISIELFGEKLQTPFIVGPTGLNGLHWRSADLMLARAASNAGTIFTASTASNSSLEDIASCSPGPKWFQLYPWGDRAVVGRLIDRAKAAQYKLMVVTVDSLIAGKRERDLRNIFSHEVRLSAKVVLDGLTHPDWLITTWIAGGGMPRFENVAEFVGPSATATDLAEFTRSQRNPSLKWDDILWIKERWGGTLLVKGINSAEDVKCALEIGLDGIIVSNHGGRQLDSAPATLDILPEIIAAAGEAMPVLIDSGFRRGTDIVKALALGARAVLLGRATLYGVASAGEMGAFQALNILRVEVEKTLALMGCENIEALHPGMLRRNSEA